MNFVRQYCVIVVGAVSCVVCMLLVSQQAFANNHFRHESRLAVRATPVGFNLASDTAYRLSLSDSEHMLLKNTYLAAGAATVVSPAFGWVGPYVEVLPLAVLQLRASAQYLSYFGAFGHVYVTENDGDWSLDKLKHADENKLGLATSGWKYDLRVTPRLRLGSIVAFSEFQFTHMSMDVDANYYEPLYDLLFAPEEFFWVARPTAGYLFGKDPSHTYLLLALRWERARATKSDVTRDTVGVVWVWKIPTTWMSWGTPQFSGFGGAHLNHPNRAKITPYLGMQFTVNFDFGK